MKSTPWSAIRLIAGITAMFVLVDAVLKTAAGERASDIHLLLFVGCLGLVSIITAARKTKDNNMDLELGDSEMDLLNRDPQNSKILKRL